MTGNELHAHLAEKADWVDWDRGVDGFKIGDPDAEISGIAVAWIAIGESLKRAHELGCNLMVTHEDPFYSNIRPAPNAYTPTADVQAFLEETGMLVYRCHDAWDVWPRIGVVDAWAQALELTCEPINTEKYYAVYPVGPLRADEWANDVLRHVRPLGQEVVHLYGDPAQAVSQVAIGTGAITNPFRMVCLGGDALICTDDPISTTAHMGWCLNMGIPVVVLNHATAEEPGIANLARYLEQQLPDVPVHHIPQGCMYGTILP